MRSLLVVIGIALLGAVAWLFYSSRLPHSRTGATAAATTANPSQGAASPVSPQSAIASHEAIAESQPPHLATHDPHAEFEHTRRCYFSTHNIQSLRKIIDNCEAAASRRANDDYPRSCKANEPDVQRQLDAEIQANAGCAAGPAMNDENFYRAVKLEAARGDPSAQTCYVYGHFNLDVSEDDQQAFRKNAQAYSLSGLQRGDWRMVRLLATRENDLSGLMASLPIGAPYEVYRMNRLLALGAKGQYLERVETVASNAATQLTLDQIAQADAWAKEEFDLYFSNSGVLESEPLVCDESS